MLIKTYTPLWNKYRPAILRMMIDSENEPQRYQLSNHEFRAMNPKPRGGYTFSLNVGNGRAISGLKDSAIAIDLWEMLKLSPRASELISSASFEIAMDNQFILKINKLNNQD